MMAYAFEKIYNRTRMIALALLFSVLLAYSVTIIKRNPAWLSEEAVYITMVKTAPNSIQGHRTLAFSYIRQGDYSRALWHVEECMRIYIEYKPINTMLKLLAGYYAVVPGTQKRVVSSGTGEINSRLLALARAREKRYQESVAMLDELTARQPELQNKPVTSFTYAVNYYHTGNTAALEEHLRWVPGSTREEKLNNLQSF
jgi:hypothetical protein